MDNCPACDKPRYTHTSKQKSACELVLQKWQEFYDKTLPAWRQIGRDWEKGDPSTRIVKDGIDYLNSKKSESKDSE